MRLFGVSVLLATALVAGAARVDGQDASGDPAAIVQAQRAQSASLAEAWLASPDPRVRTWGANLVLRDQQRQLVPQLAFLVDRYDIHPNPLAGAARDEHDAMLAVLDTIIQMKRTGNVMAEKAAALYPEFPAQAIILLASPGSLSQEKIADGLLLDIFRTEHTQTGAWLAAGNILMNHRAPGIAAPLVSGFPITLRVRVVDAGSAAPRQSGYGGDCAFGAAGPSKPGWPDVGNYYITSHVQPSYDGVGGLGFGPDATFYMRSLSGPDPAEPHADFVCADREGWNRPAVRDHLAERLLAALAHESPDAPTVRLQVSKTITWQNDTQYLVALADLVRGQRALQSALLDKLTAAGALTPAERQAARPAIAVSVSDARAARPSELPRPSDLGANVTIAAAADQ